MIKILTHSEHLATLNQYSKNPIRQSLIWELYSFGVFGPRDHDRNHGVCLPVNFATYLTQIRWIWTRFRRSFWFFRILLKTNNVRSNCKISHTHLLHTHLLMFQHDWMYGSFSFFWGCSGPSSVEYGSKFIRFGVLWDDYGCHSVCVLMV
jgi:hypothetical protein